MAANTADSEPSSIVHTHPSRGQSGASVHVFVAGSGSRLDDPWPTQSALANAAIATKATIEARKLSRFMERIVARARERAAPP